MRAARRSVQAVIVLLAASSFSSPVFSQSVQFFRVEARSIGLPTPPSSANPCSVNGIRSVAALPGDPRPDAGASSCSHSPSNSGLVVPCNLSTQPITPCAASDMVRDELNAMGKPGQSIAPARKCWKSCKRKTPVPIGTAPRVPIRQPSFEPSPSWSTATGTATFGKPQRSQASS